MKYNSSGWLFTQDKLTNDVHDITYDDIDSLIRLSLEDNTWSQDVKKQVKYFDKNPGGEDLSGSDPNVVNLSPEC